MFTLKIWRKYTPLYEKGIKPNQNKSIETTIHLTKLLYQTKPQIWFSHWVILFDNLNNPHLKAIYEKYTFVLYYYIKKIGRNLNKAVIKTRETFAK